MAQYTEELQFTITTIPYILGAQFPVSNEVVGVGDGGMLTFNYSTLYKSLVQGPTTITDGVTTYIEDGNGHFIDSPVVVVGEAYGTGDGLTQNFLHTAVNIPVRPASVTITDGVETLIDHGDGVITGSLGGYGIIDYTFGFVDVVFNTAPAKGAPITMGYQYYLGAPGIHGSINYVAGVISVTFIVAPGKGVPILLSYLWEKTYPTLIYDAELHLLMTSTTETEIVASKYVDLMQLVPSKFRDSDILQTYMNAVGLYAGIWLTKIDNMVKLLDPYTVSDQFKESVPGQSYTTDEDYMSRLGALIGLTILKGRKAGESEEEYRDRLRRQLIQAIDWYKLKGTYQALNDSIYVTNQSIIVKDFYTEDYSNFIPVDWFIADYSGTTNRGAYAPASMYNMNELVSYNLQEWISLQNLNSGHQPDINPAWWAIFTKGNPSPGPGLPSLGPAYYKSPHFGMVIVLNQVFITPPTLPYLWKGDDKFADTRAYVEQIRPVNTVPHFVVALNVQCNEDGTLYTMPDTTAKTIRLYTPWQFSRLYFDQSYLGAGQTFNFDNTRPILISNEPYGTGDGGTHTFIHTTSFLNAQIVPGSATVTDGVETFVDAGDGTFTGSLGGTGTIIYATGDCSVTFNSAPLKGVPITITYSYQYGPAKFFDFSYDTLLKDITIWKLGDGSKGVSPDTPGWDVAHEVLNGTQAYPDTIRIYQDRTEFDVVVNQAIAQSGISELGLYLGTGELVIGCTFPDIDKIAGVELRIVVTMYK